MVRPTQPTGPAEGQKLDVENAVRARYSAASQAPEASLCCPVQYAAAYLKVLPQELIERDYGCGDPSRYVQQGETVLSNCVLNLAKPEDRRRLFQEIYRVLKRGGRAVISDITCDEPVPDAMRNDPQLWSGCISGAFVESEFLTEFEQAGFYGVEIVARQQDAWAVMQGIEFRSMTVRAFKGKDGPCRDARQAVINKGPWKSVVDDDGHTLRRGQRMAVCEKTFALDTQPPYADQIEAIPSATAVDPEDTQPFDCRQNAVRPPRETKAGGFLPQDQLPGNDCCGAGGACC